MRRRLLAFVGSLRAHGLAISVGEAMDALAAVARAGVEREVLRDALAATLVKDERDRPVFEPLFEAAFPLRRAARRPARERAPGGGGSGRGDGAGGRAGGSEGARGSRPSGDATPAAARDARGGQAAAPPRPGGAAPDEPAGSAPRRAEPVGAQAGVGDADALRAAGGVADDGDHDAEPAPASGADDRRRDAHGYRPPGTADATSRRARAAQLATQPFAGWTADDLVVARDVVAELARDLRARLARRERSARRGRPDLRRTLRAAAGTGGVPLVLRRRTRRPARPDLVVLCDVSGSVATASTLCLGLLAPATPHFRRAHLFAFVDHLCPVTVEDGHVVPGGPLDLWARSDLGQVLGELWRDADALLDRTTVVLVVGDARNNRRPPRADLLRAVHARVQRVVWLVPEPRVRWNTGDSVLDRYAAHCDAVVECTDLTTLAAAVRRAL